MIHYSGVRGMIEALMEHDVASATEPCIGTFSAFDCLAFVVPPGATDSWIGRLQSSRIGQIARLAATQPEVFRAFAAQYATQPCLCGLKRSAQSFFCTTKEQSTVNGDLRCGGPSSGTPSTVALRLEIT